MESGLITPLALIRTGAAKGVTSQRDNGARIRTAESHDPIDHGARLTGFLVFLMSL